MIGQSERLEYDQILVPVDAALYPARGDVPAGYRPYTLLHLSRKLLHAVAGAGLAPLHFITQRGPFQDGETALDMRLDVRTVQIVLGEAVGTHTEYWDKRWDILDMLRPNRSFNGAVRPLIYRKWLPAGKTERGTDLAVTNGSTTVTSATGRFVERGLDAGQALTIEVNDYTVAAVPNDYTVTLARPYGGATATGVRWQYRRGWGKRDLYCLLEQGPSFDEGPDSSPYFPRGYYEVLRFVAHDPTWYGLADGDLDDAGRHWRADIRWHRRIFRRSARGWAVAVQAGLRQRDDRSCLLGHGRGEADDHGHRPGSLAEHRERDDGGQHRDGLRGGGRRDGHDRHASVDGRERGRGESDAIPVR